MVELLEYSLVVLVSSMMIGFSVVATGSFTTFSRTLDDRAAFSALTAAALDAIEQGSASASVSLASATLSCSSGTFSISSPYYSASASLPSGCDFTFGRLDGSYTFSFTASSGQLGSRLA